VNKVNEITKLLNLLKHKESKLLRQAFPFEGSFKQLADPVEKLEIALKIDCCQKIVSHA
jgi:hypothetical protein